MLHRRRALAVGWAIALGLGATTACSSAPAAAPATTTTAVRKPPTTLAAPITVSDPGKPIATTIGQTFKIRVDLDPTKDARWLVDSFDESIVFFLGESPDQDNATPGAPLTNVLQFRADKPGTTQIVLRFGTPETSAPTDKRVTFTVNVT